MEWIKIEDKQPEIHEYQPGSGTGSSDAVLVCLDDENESGTTFDVWRMYRGGRGDTTSIHWDWDYPKVTHWMPIVPPKASEAKNYKHMVIQIDESGSQITSNFIDSLQNNTRLVCIGPQAVFGTIDLNKVAATLVDIEQVGDSLGVKRYAHLEVLATPMGSLLETFSPLTLLVHFSNFSFRDGELIPGYIEVLPK